MNSVSLNRINTQYIDDNDDKNGQILNRSILKTILIIDGIIEQSNIWQNWIKEKKRKQKKVWKKENSKDSNDNDLQKKFSTMLDEIEEE